jgi:formylglycine-generating enzyme required for sulfatase activity
MKTTHSHQKNMVNAITYEVFEFETVSVNDHGELIEHRKHSARQVIVKINSEKPLLMVEVPGGDFLMGSPPGSVYDDEYPQHHVRIHPFLLGKYPVTQEQWAAVMDWIPPYRCKGTNKPVDRVSWDDATAFCERLSVKVGYGVRLPSEAEWEYACRAGTTTPFYFGGTITTKLANYNGEHQYRSEPRGIYRHQTLEVGSFSPNPFGLYEMHGTVWEWCADAWHNDYTGAPDNGSAWEGDAGSPRVLRGGCWHDPPNLSRSAARLMQMPYEREDFFGFRVALSKLQPTT